MSEWKPPLFCGMAWRWGCWFRVCGHGLHIKLARDHVPVFSERYGYTKPLYLLGLRIVWLTPRGAA